MKKRIIVGIVLLSLVMLLITVTGAAAQTDDKAKIKTLVKKSAGLRVDWVGKRPGLRRKIPSKV